MDLKRGVDSADIPLPGENIYCTWASWFAASECAQRSRRGRRPTNFVLSVWDPSLTRWKRGGLSEHNHL
jgi:hypothetical protein